jgi:acyl-CoA synthetase (AMP-forming)/AMP-acid ligase II
MKNTMTEAQYLARLHELWRQHWPREAPRELRYPFGERPLTDYLREWARRTPEKPALIFYGAELSYAELDRQSDRFAAWLAAHGARKGDRVAVFLPNCPQFHIVFFGILKLGCIHVPVNPLFKEHELIYELNDTEAEIIVALDQLFPLVEAVKPRTKLREVLVTSFADALPQEPTIPAPESVKQPKLDCPGATDLLAALAALPDGCPAVEVGLDDLAALNYTGGTTGMPKGCAHTQRNMLYTAATACTIGGRSSADVSLNFMPVFWIAGEDVAVIFPIFAGYTCVLLTRWDPVAFMAAVDRYKVTTTGMLVDNLVEILESPEAGNYDLRSILRLGVSSFVKKLNVEYRRRWHALTGSNVVESAWGMTETHTVDTFTIGMQEDDFDLKSKPIFVGLPMPGTEFKILDFETRQLKPLGEEGEIVVRSPSLLKTYWNKPEATAEALRDGWLHTGDIGMIDEQGYLHFLGRRKEMLKVKGMSVFPAEIEALLGQHPSVLGSGVIGVEDNERGQAPVAFVRIRPEDRGRLTETELTEWCRRNMATYKVPRIRFVGELPLTATGKVKKEELGRLLDDAHNSGV